MMGYVILVNCPN